MIERPTYLKRLISFKNKDLIKIVTGIRGSGKSITKKYDYFKRVICEYFN